MPRAGGVQTGQGAAAHRDGVVPPGALRGGGRGPRGGCRGGDCDLADHRERCGGHRGARGLDRAVGGAGVRAGAAGGHRGGGAAGVGAAAGEGDGGGGGGYPCGEGDGVGDGDCGCGVSV